MRLLNAVVKRMDVSNEEHPAPDHNTICRFRSKYLAGHEDELLRQMTAMLVEWGFVSIEAVIIGYTEILP